METGTITMDTLNFSPFMLMYSWHVEPEGAMEKPIEGSDMVDHKTKGIGGLKTFPINVSVKNRQIHVKS
jgi:hypothetical protein